MIQNQRQMMYLYESIESVKTSFNIDISKGVEFYLDEVKE